MGKTVKDYEKELAELKAKLEPKSDEPVKATGKKIAQWDFFCKAYKSLRRAEDISAGRKGLHATFSGFNQAFCKYYNTDLKDLITITQAWQTDGKIKVIPVKGGVLLYMASDAPEKNVDYSADKALKTMGI